MTGRAVIGNYREYLVNRKGKKMKRYPDPFAQMNYREG